MESTFDPTGPGTEAWEASDETIRHLINGRPDEAVTSHARMVRALLDAGRSAAEIREWESQMEDRVANPEPDDYDTDEAAKHVRAVLVRPW